MTRCLLFKVIGLSLFIKLLPLDHGGAQTRFQITLPFQDTVGLTRGNIIRTNQGFAVSASQYKHSINPTLQSYNSSLIFGLDSCYNVTFSKNYRNILVPFRLSFYNDGDFLTQMDDAIYFNFFMNAQNQKKIFSTLNKLDAKGDLKWAKTTKAYNDYDSTIYSYASNGEITSGKSALYSLRATVDTTDFYNKLLFSKLNRNGKVLSSKFLQYSNSDTFKGGV